MPLRLIDHTGRYRIVAQFQLEIRDVWIGIFWRKSEMSAKLPIWHLYICLLPCVPLHITWSRWK